MADNSVPSELIEVISKTVTRLETVILGIPGTEEVGLVGEVKQIRKTLEAHCAKSNGNSWKKWGAFGAGLGLTLTGSGTALAKLLGL